MSKKPVKYLDYQVYPGEPSCKSSFSNFWRDRYGLKPVGKLPDLDAQGRCERPDCQGCRIPGYLKPVDSFLSSSANTEIRIRISEAVVLYCPDCNREAVFPLKSQAEPAAVEAPIILEPQASAATIEVINLAKYRPSILAQSDVVYVARQAEWRGQYLHASLLANSYRIGFHGTRHEVCEKFLSEILNPALEVRAGSVWDALLVLAQRFAAGESLRLACWCAPERCHAYDIAAAVKEIAQEIAHA